VVEYRLDQFEDAVRAMEDGKYVVWSFEEDEDVPPESSNGSLPRAESG
jgi:hypothetical protein